MLIRTNSRKQDRSVKGVIRMSVARPLGRVLSHRSESKPSVMIGLLPRVLRFAAICATTLFFILVIINTNPSANNETVSSVDEEAALIDSALYTRVEFFGSQAYVPYPTAEARNRLSDLQTKYPNRPEVYLRLAQFDEKLGREEDALKNMRAFVEHEPDKMKGLTGLAQYFHRRAQFAAEGETLERMLDIAPQDRRTAIFRDLLQLAETHLLEKYLSPAFLNQTVEKNPDTFEIVNHYIDRLTEQKNFQQALNLVRQYKAKFPEQTDVTLEMEVSLLDHLHRTKEAEAIYHAAFDPFWTAAQNDKYYGFLKEHDRYRTYGYELRDKFNRNPANRETANRLIH